MSSHYVLCPGCGGAILPFTESWPTRLASQTRFIFTLPRTRQMNGSLDGHGRNSCFAFTVRSSVCTSTAVRNSRGLSFIITNLDIHPLHQFRPPSFIWKSLQSSAFLLSSTYACPPCPHGEISQHTFSLRLFHPLIVSAPC